MRRTALLLTLVAAGLAAGPAHAGGFEAGAAKVDITPPRFDPSDDARDLVDPTTGKVVPCPAGLDGPRAFRFQEPYRDVNGNGTYDYPEPFCDANHDAHYDGLYQSSHTDSIAQTVHDPIDARAVAVSGDGGRPVVIVSVIAQGIFENYIAAMRAELARRMPVDTPEMIVSSNHNESSPDTLGIYGAPSLFDITGARTGIDEYYMHFLEDRVVDAAVAAVHSMRPARLYAATDHASGLQRSTLGDAYFPLLDGALEEHLSHQFPTTDDDGKPVAVEDKLRVLQARDVHGTPIFTMLNLSAHNQLTGQQTDGTAIGGDWPGYFHRAMEAAVPGMPLFLAGLIGSQEDPEPIPHVKNDPYARAKGTGELLAAAVQRLAGEAEPVRPGPVRFARRTFFVPLDNTAFRGLAAAGIFGERPLYTAGTATGPVGNDVRTSVSLVDLGPDVQFMSTPAESFPALAIGGPWTIDDAPCPDRPNPPVPDWLSHAAFRFNIGLADDLLGYIGPSWAFVGDPGFYATTCQDDKGHDHSLETESAGPTAGNLVAENLAALLAADDPDPTAVIGPGRYIDAGGAVTPQPSADTVAIWLPAPGATALTPGAGTIVARPGVASVAGRTPDATGEFMDYDGAEQDGADINTRGMLVRHGHGPAVRRYYLRVYDHLDAPAKVQVGS